MFLKPPWAVLPFVQWEDTLNYHARLFRCFLDAHNEFAVPSQGSQWMSALVGQQLADMGLMHDAGRLREPVSHRTSSLGRHTNMTIRCPPKRRYEATTSLPSFTVNSPVDPVPPFVPPRSIDLTHSLHTDPIPPTALFDPPGPGRLPGGYVDLSTSLAGLIPLWLLTLAVVISCCASAGSGSARAMCRPPRVAVGPITSSSERIIRHPVQGAFPMAEVTQSAVGATMQDADPQVPMPGAWLQECQERSMLETLESVFDTMLRSLSCSCVQMGTKAWAYFLGWASIFAALDPWNLDLNDVVVIEQKSRDGRSSGLDPGISITASLNKNERQGAAWNRSPSEESGLRGSTVAMLNRHWRPLPIGDVAIRNPDQAQTTIMDVECRDVIGSTFSLVLSSSADHPWCQEDISSDIDDSGSEDKSDGTEEEGLFSTQHVDISAILEKKDEYRILGQRQDGALSDTGCASLLRRAGSSTCLWKQHGILHDDDDGAGDDSYWTEQVNARLSGEQGSRRASGAYDWSDVSSWPREGREDETDNWRTRGSQTTHFETPEKTSDRVRCQVDRDSTRLGPYSSLPFNLDASFSHRSVSGDGPQGIYIVPQKRGRITGAGCWSPVSSPPDRPSGLGFFPFRTTPSLLTPEAWRPGCLCVPDPPVDEARQADVWWENLGSADSCEDHRYDTGTGIQDAGGPLFSRDAHGLPFSWRDRHKNDPASRRFVSVHRRTMTEG